MKYFVTATHTDAGKTFVSALLVKALEATYWKPVQSGIEIRDTEEVQRLAGISQDKIIPEAYLLKSPESPHSSASKEGVEIDLSTITMPTVQGNLIVEGAGGILVPLNDNETIADLIAHLDLEILLVVPTYLGCINHSLLTLELIKSRGLKLKAIIFNGEESTEAQKIIVDKAGGVPSVRVNTIDTTSYDAIESEVAKLSFLG